MKSFALGLDFGTESARALLLDVKSGQNVVVGTHPFRHGVLVESLPDGKPLGQLWALQHPADYLEALQDLMGRAGSRASDLDGTIQGIGVAFTSSTVMPVKQDGTPLALIPELASEPHAYIKLWKHHASEEWARRINDAEPYFLRYYGGKTSAEWSLAKAWQVMEEAPWIWEETDRWIEAGDWIVWQLIGREVRSVCQAGYKAHWHPEWGGYPRREELGRLHPELGTWLNRLSEPEPIGSRAGGLLKMWSHTTGLEEGTPVAVAAIDAHAAVPGTNVSKPGTVVAVLGTSACHMALGIAGEPLPGIAGVVPDGILPGYVGYEAGQAATGDTLAWWVRTLAWASGQPEDALFDRLNEEAAQVAAPSELTVLDWWNGCRTPLMDGALRGAITGLHLTSSPAEIYRALVEGTAFGTRLIVESLENATTAMENIVITGGLSSVPFIMQVYADVLGRPVHASKSPHATAVGAAVYGAMAAGTEAVVKPDFDVFEPLDAEFYQDRYQRYLEMFEFFGRTDLSDVAKSQQGEFRA